MVTGYIITQILTDVSWTSRGYSCHWAGISLDVLLNTNQYLADISCIIIHFSYSKSGEIHREDTPKKHEHCVNLQWGS